MVEWRDVVGWEGIYKVSNDGLVKTCKHVRYTSDQKRMLYEERLRKQSKHAHGYMRVTLAKGQLLKVEQTHRLVAKAFIPNPNNLPFVNHIDGDKANNRVENLEWCTRQENMNHAVRIGLVQRGSNAHRSKLVEQQVIAIRKNINGLSVKKLAALFNISQQNVNNIIKGRTWKHLLKNKQLKESK